MALFGDVKTILPVRLLADNVLFCLYLLTFEQLFMKKIESLLAKVDSIRKKAEEYQVRNHDKGTDFDVFSVTGFWDEEVRLHSAIISELLDPHGSHGAGGVYLSLFIETLGRNDFPLDSELVKPHRVRRIRERYIGPKTETTGGKLDIIIEDGKHALIIENKPGYEDQKNQLLRYHNYLNGYEQGILVYLTKDGRKASETSTGRKDFNYECMSFEQLLQWLGKCARASAKRPNVHSVIKQYQYHINKIMGTTMDERYCKKLLSLMTKKSNVLSVKEILCNGEQWLDAIVEEYVFKPLSKYAESKQMKSDSNSDGSDFWIYKDSWKHYAVFLCSEKSKWRDLFIGVSWYDEPGRSDRLYLKNCDKMDCVEEDKSKDYPYGWESLPSDLCYFGYDNADRIINGEVSDWIIQKFDEILNEIESKNLRMP